MAKDKTKKKWQFKMPNAYVIVFAVLVLVAVLSFFVPVSVHDPVTGAVVYNASLDENGAVVPGTGALPMGLWDVLLAPVQGFISAADVGVALLIAGGFLNILSFSGGLSAGIGIMLTKLQGNVLIALLNLVCALMGSVYGFWEETIPFSLVVVPIFLMAGYDLMTGIAVLFIGATVGNMASVVNPFATGAAVAAIHNPELTLGSGIVLRGIIFVVLYVVSTIMIIRYANRVKADKTKSVTDNLPGVKLDTTDKESLPEMNGRRAASLTVFILVVVFLIIGYIPWEALGGEGAFRVVNAPFLLLEKVPVLGDILGAGHVTYFGDWGFNEFSFIFFLGSLVLMIINKMNADDFIDHFLVGASDLLGVVFVLGISRGIAILMGDATQGMSVTFVYWISNALSKTPLWIFSVFAVLAYVGIGLFLQSTSGVAGISMPILGAVAVALYAASPIGSKGGEIILISAFNLGLNFMCCVYPGAENLGVTAKYNIPYNVYLKFMLRYLTPLLILGMLIISIAPYIGLAV